MRLIDADALIEDIKTKLWDWDTVDGITSSTVLKQTITDIGNAPTIDAVQVIRCKDCKRRRNAAKNGRVYWNGYEYYCEIAHYGVLDDGFCFYGERKDDE
jgi:hypothetical protein